MWLLGGRTQWPLLHPVQAGWAVRLHAPRPQSNRHLPIPFRTQLRGTVHPIVSAGSPVQRGTGGGRECFSTSRPKPSQENKEGVPQASPTGTSWAPIQPSSFFFRAPALEPPAGAGPHRVSPLLGSAPTPCGPHLGGAARSRGAAPGNTERDQPWPPAASRRPPRPGPCRISTASPPGGVPAVGAFPQSPTWRSVHARNTRQCGELQPQPPQVRPEEREPRNAATHGCSGAPAVRALLGVPWVRERG
ncbi:hypothetical protein NDU88_003560 [Pleurodeles waltl]|uniref:Uncharacterized protein n=1 Tax=Pleurodeles waltl TaxID=8319 RepID=A0AAV7NH98_PLEWA|nr:hypothetical protein NDU88_003560 [Pleurodeles waltl]